MKRDLSHRGIVRLDWFQGLRCCHLLSLSVVASCLSAQSQNKPVHMSGLRCSLRLCACARPQKRVNASVRLTGPSLPCYYGLTSRNFNELVGLFLIGIKKNVKQGAREREEEEGEKARR